MSRICVKNLTKIITEKDLKAHFTQYGGDVTDVRIIRSKDGKSRQFGFIGYRTEEQANEAKRLFQHSFIGQCRIEVEIAKKLGDETLKINPKQTKEKKVIEKSNPIKENTKPIKDSIKLSKKKQEFLDLMKIRREGKVWNDDGGNLNETVVQEEKEETDDDTNDEDVSVANEIEIREDFTNQTSKEMSDMEYLQSKKKNWSEFENEQSIHYPQDNDDEQLVPQSIDENYVESVEIDKELIMEDDNARIYIKNIPYSCTEDELKELGTTFGPVNEVHIPIDSEKKGKGFGFIHFLFPEHAKNAVNDLNGSSFQGRLIHVSLAEARKVVNETAIINSKTNRLSSFQLKKEEERRKNAQKSEGWNSTFIRSDTIVGSLANSYQMKESDIMDPTASGGNLAVRMAVGESQVIQDTMEFFASHGVNLSALESMHSKERASKRSTTTILIKNLPHNTIDDEIESMFVRFGSISSFLIPKSKAIALVEFTQPSEARAAYKGLAYRKYKHVPLYLEWAPLDIITKPSTATTRVMTKDPGVTHDPSIPEVVSEDKVKEGEDDSEYSTLFIKNLNFVTNEMILKEHILRMEVQGLRTVSIQKKTKGAVTLSQGYGFIEFINHDCAMMAMKLLNGSVLDSHALEVKPSQKRLSSTTSVPSSRSSIPLKKDNGNKLIIRNLAFQANRQEIYALFSSFGSVKRVRIPKKMNGENRGFAFIEFATPQEATSAMNALKQSHLYGRHLVIEYANESEEDYIDVYNKLATVESTNESLDNTKKSKIDLLRKRSINDMKGILQERKRSKANEKNNMEDDVHVDLDAGMLYKIQHI